MDFMLCISSTRKKQRAVRGTERRRLLAEETRGLGGQVGRAEGAGIQVPPGTGSEGAGPGGEGRGQDSALF